LSVYVDKIVQVIKEVEVPREVVREVIREVPVEVEVVKEVIREVPREVVREVIREVPVEVIREVDKIVGQFYACVCVSVSACWCCTPALRSLRIPSLSVRDVVATRGDVEEAGRGG
jgi:hypothetical protein